MLSSGRIVRAIAAALLLPVIWRAGETAISAPVPASGISAEARSFWAFQPVRRADPPAVKDQTWPKTGVDRFLLAAMESKGVRPLGPVDKRTLLRRLYIDLIGIPPTADEVKTFQADGSAAASSKIVDRLLTSPQYGERWARFWLDIARYSDDRLESEMDAPYPNAFRYRDWVIQALNADLPYDLFVKSQIAGDQIEGPAGFDLRPGLGFYALGPDTQDDRVDVTTRAFLGLTGGCAQCHDHKFDPILAQDYYRLLGVFTSTETGEVPLAPEQIVKTYKEREKAVQTQKTAIREFLYSQATELANVLAAQTATYVMAARRVLVTSNAVDPAVVAEREQLDLETLRRWVAYLRRSSHDHPFLKNWKEDSFDPAGFQQQVLTVLRERKSVDETNIIRRAEAKKQGEKVQPQLAALSKDSYFLWRDLFFSDFYGSVFKQEEDGLLYYGPNRGYVESDGTVERFLSGIWKNHLERLRSELRELQAQVPKPYPFIHVIRDKAAPKNEKLRYGGVSDRLGPEVQRGFLSVFSGDKPLEFHQGSGRRELAEVIASPENPLTARVIVNRLWHHHFGAGLVRTPSDFGKMGDRPSHPELLDYLADRLIENRWSLKSIHREIVLSAAYQLSSSSSDTNAAIDPDNRLLWRANPRQLDAEALRDSLLAVSGELATTSGGPSQSLADAANVRRTIYGFVSRRKLDPALALFDFPNPNASSEKRVSTISALQQLFFLNGSFVERRAARIAGELENAEKGWNGRVRLAYRRVFAREPSAAETQSARKYLDDSRDDWRSYVQALLSSNEFGIVR